MAQRFSYRAVMTNGAIDAGFVEAPDYSSAIESLRRSGARPILVTAVGVNAVKKPKGKVNAKMRLASINLTGELAVLLNAGLPLDRSLSLAITNVEDKAAAAEFSTLLEEVRKGVPLSQAMQRRQDLFSPAASAMTEAGEANGALGPALTRLAEMLERAEALRRLIATSMIYPIALTVIAVGVILLMLLFVVPQFESLFGQAKDKLPPASAFVMGASRFVREWGWWLLVAIVSFGFMVRHLLSRPAMRIVTDRIILRIPQLGTLVRYIETARFARTLGVLIEGNVALPHALTLARRTVANVYIGNAIAQVAEGVREGGGLAAPLAAAKIFPKMAIGFLRTGEETSQLGLMLGRLADVLDRDVAIRVQRLIGVLTPIITIILGASVAAIIAAIMSAIIGFNELAISS